jgi:hypothetical protein
MDANIATISLQPGTLDHCVAILRALQPQLTEQPGFRRWLVLGDGAATVLSISLTCRDTRASGVPGHAGGARQGITCGTDRSTRLGGSMLEPERLTDTWRLITCEARSAEGAVLYLYGEDPIGTLMYDAKGNMIGIIMRAGRPRFASGDVLNGTSEEVRAAFEGCEAHTGTYEVDAAAGTVTHQIIAARFPNWEGTSQVRHVELNGNRLAIRTPPIALRGTTWTFGLVWERA